MGQSVVKDDIVDLIRGMSEQLRKLERSVGVPQYTAAERPAAADAEGTIIYNQTTRKHQGSDGSVWNDLF